MIFIGITADKCNSVHNLFLFLHKLKVIGTVYTETRGHRRVRCDRSHGKYDLLFDGYDPTTKNQISAEEKLAAYFRASEALGQYDDDPCIEPKS